MEAVHAWKNERKTLTIIIIKKRVEINKILCKSGNAMLLGVYNSVYYICQDELEKLVSSEHSRIDAEAKSDAKKAKGELLECSWPTTHTLLVDERIFSN